ncbi:hypothetical protein G7074_11460 [Pedobacter sp. HDW13]|uniref:hypothetical protein n=1 Tax=unclassified Pedobacter TaxID=2628915 RepID=UPI000F5ADECC|nr:MULTISPECIES: hypothetical protein [unclassified Pedobacter]QIL39827.1 hypothetical protein G7074_11460 [Pedobacter sp. HDW13]RQO79687.1 hypothetical protein DBR40_01645 [Pedobacter sp. KBW01]
MKLKIVPILLLILIAGCKKTKVSYDKNTVACGIKNPLENLPWLKSEFQDIAGFPETNGIVLYEFNGKEIIDIYKSYYSSLNGRQFYCDGQQVKFDSGKDLQDYIQMRKKVSILFGQKFALSQ